MKKKFKNIIFAQSINELEFIYKKISKVDNLYCVPLNLTVQLYCIEKNVPHLNPIFYINKKFHNEAILSSEKMIKNIDFSIDFQPSEKINVRTFLRFYFNSIIYLIEIIERLTKKENIKNIYVSGWFNYKDTYSKENYYLSFILKRLFKSRVIEVERKKINLRQLDHKFEYEISTKKIDNNLKVILLTNIGYNFLRILKYLFKKERILILSPENLKISKLKKIMFKFFKLQFFSFRAIKKKTKYSIKLPSIKYQFRKKFNITKLLNFRIKQEKNNIMKNRLLYKSIEKFFYKIKPSLIISNNSRNLDGLFLDYGYRKNIPFFCIPHGTISGYFNKFDKIYKKIIAESVTYPKSIYVSQSNISDWFFKKERKYFKKIIHTGNILFAENIEKKTKDKKILYAVTMKDFENIQYVGVEMYYEYLDNLSLLNELAKNYNLKIIVKNHPSIEYLTQKLKKQFENLTFSDKKIQKLLNETFCTISFSSTVIEDSLYSNKPVILLDRWKRYKHCKTISNSKFKNQAVYYINDEKKLINCINTLFKNEKIDFSFYTKSGIAKKNIANLLDESLNS